MVLVCPNCSSRFKVKPEALGEKGRLVRCANCGEKWHATVADLQEPLKPKAKSPAKKAAKKTAAKKTAAPKPAPAPEPADPPEVEEPPEAAAPPAPEPDPEPDFAGDDPLAHLDQDEQDASQAEDVPPDVPPEDEFDGPPPPIPPASHFEPREPKTKSRGPLIAWLVLLLFIASFVGGLLIFAKPLVQAYPPAAAVFRMISYPVDLLGHGFELSEATAEAHPDKTPRTMIVKGDVINTTGQTLEIPLLKGELRDTQGAVLAAWVFRASTDQALPGESVPYETETSDIPQGAASVTVTFVAEDEAMEQGLLPGSEGESEGE